MNYYKSFWSYYINEGYLNYIYLKKEQRPNSYLENYSRRIKTILKNNNIIFLKWVSHSCRYDTFFLYIV